LKFVFKLPATVATASAISAVPTATTATATSTTSRSTPAATASSKSAARATTARRATAAFAWRTSLVHNDIAAHEILAVETLNGAISLFVVVNLNEAESARLARKAVAYQRNSRRGDARLGEQSIQLLFRRLKWKITDVEFLQ